MCIRDRYKFGYKSIPSDTLRPIAQPENNAMGNIQIQKPLKLYTRLKRIKADEKSIKYIKSRLTT